LFIFSKINTLVLNETTSDKSTKEIKFKVKRKQMSIAESFKMAFSSRYIVLIAIMLFCYGFAINLAEGPWKAKLQEVFPQNEDYLSFVGSYLRMTGFFTIGFVLIGSNIVRKLGWYPAAMMTPIMLFSSGMLFFITSNFEIPISASICIYLVMDQGMLAVMLGAWQNILSKSTKYTLFDSTKEMAYVPLDDDLKTRGKAAVDTIGIKMGKSASAAIQQAIFTIFPHATYHSISMYLMWVFALVCLIWIAAVRELSKAYAQMLSKHEPSKHVLPKHVLSKQGE
jgi:AAA family ATP:ADP antiporter